MEQPRYCFTFSLSTGTTHKPFSRTSSQLSTRAEILEHLANRGLDRIYENPLTFEAPRRGRPATGAASRFPCTASRASLRCDAHRGKPETSGCAPCPANGRRAAAWRGRDLCDADPVRSVGHIRRTVRNDPRGCGAPAGRRGVAVRKCRRRFTQNPIVPGGNGALLSAHPPCRCRVSRCKMARARRCRRTLREKNLRFVPPGRRHSDLAPRAARLDRTLSRFPRVSVHRSRSLWGASLRRCGDHRPCAGPSPARRPEGALRSRSLLRFRRLESSSCIRVDAARVQGRDSLPHYLARFQPSALHSSSQCDGRN